LNQDDALAVLEAIIT